MHTAALSLVILIICISVMRSRGTLCTGRQETSDPVTAGVLQQFTGRLTFLAAAWSVPATCNGGQVNRLSAETEAPSSMRAPSILVCIPGAAPSAHASSQRIHFPWLLALILGC